MSAFNDYCIVCDRLIEGSEKLYCSASCRINDTRTGRRRSEVESLISTPQLCPLDLDTDETDSEEEPFELDYSTTVPTRLSSPRFMAKEQQDGYLSFASDMTLDRIAERNYKLWLNCNPTS
ncbi:LAFE_0H12618g1_1 [Lachancea fermentati]|uniref:LAFE_0H12618g1_1 n=1 Tax=Lachancea fermentati TaxID=4955 RepID=A0A1G4MKJ7_LACFM|nr:LAFE_0H12618g1_1 [Lachancea fermentati]